MTVIAWDGAALAADKRAVIGGGIARTVTKIVRRGDALLGITGDWDVGAELRAWWIGGADPMQFPVKAREGGATLIVIQRGRIFSYVSGPHPMEIEAPRAAWGSGRDYAEAAMLLGCDARRAVEVACELQTDCGNGVDVLAL
ncbi:MAG: hypothetical protein HYZ20_19665 [Burkholderiales bacterium]|nr:hypothetical protein [Burkholderiales bacterium]